MSYDTSQFYNASMAVVVGCCIGAMSYLILPPVSPATRTHRLLRLTLRDFRSLCRPDAGPSRDDWETLIYGRLAAIPDSATPQQRSEILAALSLGLTLIRLRRALRSVPLKSELGAALASLARGDAALARDGLQRVDMALANHAPVLGRAVADRARGLLKVMDDGLVQHAAYFSGRYSNDVQ